MEKETLQLILIQGAARGLQIGIWNGVKNSGCPGNIKIYIYIYIECPHSHKSELGDGTHGAGPLIAVLHSNSFAANLWHGHWTHLQLLTGFMDMLKSCGHALSQGDERDFNPGWNWEVSPSGYSSCMRGKRRNLGAHMTLEEVGDHVAWAKVRTRQLWGAPFCHMA